GGGAAASKKKRSCVGITKAPVTGGRGRAQARSCIPRLGIKGTACSAALLMIARLQEPEPPRRSTRGEPAQAREALAFFCRRNRNRKSLNPSKIRSKKITAKS